MGAYIARRLLTGLFTLWIVTIAVSLLIHLVPGDPVRIMYAQSQSTGPEQIEAKRHELGLDQPIYVQYLNYMTNVLHGDLGKTIRGEQPVLTLLMLRLPNTILLTVASLIFAILIGGTIGFFSAYFRGTWFDTLGMGIAIAGIAMPSFWLGLLLMFFFSVRLGWFPVGGTGLASLVLPGLTLGLVSAAVLARLTRSSMLDVLGQDYMRTARSKGLAEPLVLARHALKNCLIPILTMLGLQVAYLLGGAVVVENVFAWNGVGRLAVQAILQRDFPLIQGFVLLFAVIVIGVSLIVDVLYAVVDPRIRYQS
jgi:ABC-type dipeptide/oligopeptide/nickel transport system permease component